MPMLRLARSLRVVAPVTLAGLVEATNVTNVSFEVAGIVNALKVEVGDRIEKGQVLAIMDESRYQLNVEAAQAALALRRRDRGDGSPRSPGTEVKLTMIHQPEHPLPKPTAMCVRT